MRFHYRNLYSKLLEIYDGLYQIIGWRNLDKVQDFQYLEFILRVQELSCGTTQRGTSRSSGPVQREKVSYGGG
jgi:hypothetical protein